MNIKLLKPTADNISSAAKSLMFGNLVAFPTETVYGLGANATDPYAISRIYSVKGRPADHPLIVHVSDISKLDIWAENIPKFARELASKYWPGPMTLILERSHIAQDFITGNQNTVAIRIPNHPIALDLLTSFEAHGGLGIAAPSANRFGAVSPTSGEDVISELGDFISNNDFILDGGKSSIGIESTIIDCTANIPRILRPGAITEDMVQISNTESSTTNYKVIKIKHSGEFESHYSPRARVFLNQTPQKNDGLIAFNNVETPAGVFRLASPTTLEEYANQLYSALRKADNLKLSRVIAVTPISKGLGIAICDRLNKAAAN